MALNLEDIIEIHNELRTALIKTDLSWIIEQYDEEVEQGKIIEKKGIELKKSPSLFPEEYSFEKSIQNSKSDKFIISIPYTEEEKLTLLLDSISHIFEIIEIEKTVFNFFSDKIKNFKSIQFYNEQKEGMIEINKDDLKKNEINLIEIKNLIEKIKMEYNAK